MRWISTIFLVLGLALLASSATAASCQTRAASLAASQNGSVLSVVAMGNKCKIKILIRPKNGPPKQKTFVVSK